MSKVETPYDALTYQINGLAMDIHNELGPGFTEDIYQPTSHFILGCLGSSNCSADQFWLITSGESPDFSAQSCSKQSGLSIPIFAIKLNHPLTSVPHLHWVPVPVSVDLL